MTEKQKMLAGENYNSRDPELLSRYKNVRSLLHKYNNKEISKTAKNRTLLQDIFGSVGENVWVETPFLCDYGEQVHISNDVFINYNCVFLDSNMITIGANTLIGPAVHIYTATHPLLASERITDSGYLTSSKPVRIEEKCWIGGGSLIMPGITIGKNSTIGAGSVVTKSVPANCFAAGNPCRLIKKLEHFDEAQ